jgi:hypothetical protein
LPVDPPTSPVPHRQDQLVHLNKLRRDPTARDASRGGAQHGAEVNGLKIYDDPAEANLHMLCMEPIDAAAQERRFEISKP